MSEPDVENPFASPMVIETAARVAAEPPPTLPNGSQLASRRQRLHAALLDGVLMAPFYLMSDGSVHSAGGEWGLKPVVMNASNFTPILIGGLMIIPFALLNGVLLANKGQTFGKWLCRIAIVRYDGQPARFANLIWIRYLPFWLLILVPYLNILCLIDVAWMFVSKNRRCLHDYFAGTMVVNVE